MASQQNIADVIVVGFGPVGAVLAGLLGKRGLRVHVIEQAFDVFPLPRAAHVDHTGLRTWQELGILDQILPQMRPNLGLDFVTADGDLLSRVSGDQASPSGLPSSMYFFQPALDRLVRESVSALPTVEIAFGTAVTGLEQHSGHAVVSATTATGEYVQFAGRWIIGCDGATSKIRDLVGIALEDSGFEEPWLVVDLVVKDPADAPDRAVCWCDPQRPTYSIPMPLGRHRFEFRLMDGDDPVSVVDPDNIHGLVARWFPRGTVDVERSAIYTFHGLVAHRWKEGRVLLAGDAAHQMPPFLGQGMCSGLRDAANLAWKLALVIQDDAPAAILETYESERKAHASAVVEAAVAFGRIICVVDPDEAARRDRDLLGDSRPDARRLSFALPDVALGALILEGGGELFVQPPGTSERLDDYVGQRFAVLSTRPEDLQSPAAQWWRDCGSLVVAVEGLPVDFQESARSWLAKRNSHAVIVRPDRYTLWSGADLGDATSRVAGVLSKRPYVHSRSA